MLLVELLVSSDVVFMQMKNMFGQSMQQQLFEVFMLSYFRGDYKQFGDFYSWSFN
jgi:hypothetical protein